MNKRASEKSTETPVGMIQWPNNNNKSRIEIYTSTQFVASGEKAQTLIYRKKCLHLLNEFKKKII